MTQKLIITAEQNASGKWVLKANGQDAQEGYGYDSKAEALDAATHLWPTNSLWHGRRVSGGWQIDADTPDF